MLGRGLEIRKLHHCMGMLPHSSLHLKLRYYLATCNYSVNHLGCAHPVGYHKYPFVVYTINYYLPVAL